MRSKRFRMALLSGEVETLGAVALSRPLALSSGWLCYPGTLKRFEGAAVGQADDLFRMALLSGEVETTKT